MPKSNFNNFQNWGTVFALLISVLALTVSIYETNLMAEQQRATVWPYLYIGRNYKINNFELELFNNGTGPAIIKSVEISVGDRPVEDYYELFKVLEPGHQIKMDSVKISRLKEQVIRAGDNRIILSLPWSDAVNEVVDQIDRVNIKINYCSVLYECWTYDFQTNERIEGNFRAKVEFEN